MKKLLLAASLLIMTSFVNAQYLNTATYITSRDADEIKEILYERGWDTTAMSTNGAEIYKITYNTTDVFGNLTIASGALYVPQVDCDTLPLVSYQHGTEFHKEHVPSETWYYDRGFLYSGNGYITVLPDYLGLGDNPGLHPYIHWESEATASIDLIRAAREFLNESLQKWDNNQLFLTGYSQGGHSTMAIHKYVTVNNLQDEFNIVASAPLSGPFPLYDFQLPEMFGGDSTYYAPEFIPYIFASYQMVYGNLYTFYNEYYDPPYDSIIGSWVASGTEWGTLPTNIYDFVQDSVLDNIQSNPNHPFNVDLRENDLHNWIPEEAVRMLYCGMDSMVFPENSTMALDTMIYLGATDVQALNLDPNADHNGCFIPATTYALVWFDNLRLEVCDSIAGPPVSVPTFEKQPEISLYPNPFSSSTIIEYELSGPGTADITIFNHLGQIVESTSLVNSQSGKQQYVWNASEMPAGIYFVQVRVGNEVTTRKMIKR